MRLPRTRRALAIHIIGATGIALVTLTSSTGVAAASRPSVAPSTVFVQAPPAGAAGPDDITRLATPGLDGGRALIWTAFQNGINPDGTPGTTGGPTQSTVAGYDPVTGSLVETIAVTGHVDGLTADPGTGYLIATDNEDVNSSFNLINPTAASVAVYSYSPDPASSGNGGTDSIAIWHGQIVVTHSNPSDATQATDYRVTLDDATHTAFLAPLFFDNSAAIDPLTHQRVTLALTDPDTNLVMPATTPRFAGQLATISQGDGEVIFDRGVGSSEAGRGRPSLTVLPVSDNVPGNVPPIDGMAVATAPRGTLYVVDSKAGSIIRLSTAGWPVGTVFVSEPSDNGNPLVGTLDLRTGVITPLGNRFISPKGLLFVPDGS